MKYFFALFTALAAVALGYYLNLKTADVRYQLSSPIPTETGPNVKVVQQIEIANVGKAVAQRVQVKIKKTVAKLTVIKDSHTDNFSQFDSSGSSELVYDSLRPAGRVNIVLTGSEPLTEHDVEVRHLEGPAKLALTSEPSLWSGLASYFSLALIVLYFGLSARSFARDQFASKSRFRPEVVLKNRKPILVSTSDWISNLEEAASRLAEQQLHETSDVSSWVSYKLLDSGKPESIPVDVWDKVVPKLTDAFVERVKETAAYACVHGRSAEVRKLLAVPKPSGIFDELWSRLMKSLSGFYVCDTCCLGYSVVSLSIPPV